MDNPPFSVDLQGASNVRDLGGYRGANGRLVRRGLLYRSAALATLAPADLATFSTLGVRIVCDLRGDAERRRAPTLLTGPVNLPLPIEPTVGSGLRDILHRQEATGEALHAVLEQAYVAYAIDHQAQYRAMFARILAGELPLLFHCSAGKDRTGFGAAMILTALGVGWDDVVADFEATNRLWARDTVPAADIPESIREALLSADARLLTAAFAAAERQHGSLAGYLEHALGIGPAAMADLHGRLLES